MSIGKKLLSLVVLLGVCTIVSPQQYYTTLDGYSAVLNYAPGNADSQARPNGAIGSGTAYSYNHVPLPDLSEAGLDNGFTVELWYQWKGLFVATLQNQSVIHVGGDANNFIVVSPCNNSFLDEFTRCPGFIIARVGGVEHYIQTDTMYSRSDLRWVHLAVTVHPTNPSLTNIRFAARVNGSSNPMEMMETTYPLGFTMNPTSFASFAATVGACLNPAVQNILGAFSVFIGKVDEVRVWNHVRTEEQIRANRNIILRGNTTGLLAYYTFDDDPVNTGFVKDETGQYNTTLVVSYPPQVYRISQSVARATDTTVLPILSLDRPLTAYTPIFVTVMNTGPAQMFIDPVNLPTLPRYCNGSVGFTDTCQSPFPIPSGRALAMTVLPTRAMCGVNMNLLFRSVEDGVYSVTNVTWMLQYGTIFPSITTSPVNFTLPTTGGIIDIQGVDLGVDQVLDTATEYFRLSAIEENIFQKELSCAPASVVQSGSVLRCNVPPAIGTRHMSFRLCGHNFTYPLSLRFQPPTIDTAFGTLANASTTVKVLLVRGTNFGPSRPFNNPALDDIRIMPDITCAVQSVNHSSITCLPSQELDPASDYQIRVTIGGQTAIKNFTYASCDPPCENGVCSLENFCDCESGFYGPTCSLKFECRPACKNNGTCVESTDGSGLKCQCPPGFGGADCGGDGDGANSAALIGGVVGGGGGLVLILGAMIVVLLIKRRQGKRGGRNFIPLEKKDFTKIIYGDQLTQQPEKLTGNPKQFEETLVQDNLELAVLISNVTQITEADKIAKALIVVFQENSKVLPLLEAFITEEVTTTESAGTLFRSNSMVSKMFKFYSRLIGLPYLYETIGPELNELIEQELGLEVDPEKMEEGTDLDEMRWTLMAQSQKILKQILKSVDKCPAQFRSLLTHIKNSVAERFPENVNTTIGGFIFLRFFCPAVSSPEAYGIVEEPPSASARRLLILITKVLQNLSNDVEFGSKEPYMTKMNDFIHSNRVKLVKFYEDLVKPSTKQPIQLEMPKHIKQLSLQVLMHHMRENIARVEDAQMRAKIEAML